MSLTLGSDIRLSFAKEMWVAVIHTTSQEKLSHFMAQLSLLFLCHSVQHERIEWASPTQVRNFNGGSDGHDLDNDKDLQVRLFKNPSCCSKNFLISFLLVGNEKQLYFSILFTSHQVLSWAPSLLLNVENRK